MCKGKELPLHWALDWTESLVTTSKGVKVAFTPRCVLAVALPAIYSNILIHVMVKEGE